MAIGGRDIYDTAVTLGQHDAQLMLHAQQRAENVGVEGGRIAFGRLLRHRTRLAFGSGGVYSSIQATKARHGLIDQVSYVVLVTHVGIHIFRLRVEAAELSYQILAGFVASTRDDDARTLFREGQGGSSSDAREGASDQNNGGVHKILLRLFLVGCFLIRGDPLACVGLSNDHIVILPKLFSQPTFLHPLGWKHPSCMRHLRRSQR